jgi:group II intron reverse transcriptase/maturase
MRWLFRLVYVVVRLLLEWGVRLSLELVGCSVRLLYWSVRTYGWGRVGSFLAALWVSLWVHHHFGWLSLSSTSLGSVAVGTLGLWGGLLGLSLWLTHWWHRRTDASRVPSRPTAASAWLGAPVVLGAPPAETSSASAGVKNGGTPLWEQVVHPTTLQIAWQRVRVRGGGPGLDGVTVEAFTLDAERRLQHLAMELRAGSYHPYPPRWMEVPKRQGGVRQLAVLCVRDRIVQQALHLVLAPLWSKQFASCSYAYRPGRSALQAVHAVERSLAMGRVWVIDADIASFFDSVPHRPLFALLDEWLPDPPARWLIETCVAAASPEPGRGLAQGAPLSPLLANLYLHRFDMALLEAGHTLIRYADDFVILCATRQQAEVALQMAKRLLQGLALSLNPDKTRIVHRDEGFTFLGYTFTKDGKRPSEEALASLQARLAATSEEHTRRQILAGWQGYFGETPVSDPRDGYPGHEASGADEGDPDAPWWAEREDEARALLSTEVDGSLLALYRARFVGRPAVFARYWQRAGRKGYIPVRRAVTDEDLRAHLAGQEILGTYLLHPDGTTRAVVLDVDGPTASEEGRARAFPVARRLADTLHRHGIPPLWVDSGGKGFHLWLCFTEPVPAKSVRQWMATWLDQFRPFPEGVLVEVFPKQDSLAPGGLGALLRLPLGRHPETGRPSRLLTLEGEPVADPWPFLARAPWVDGQALLESPLAQVSSLPEPPETIAPVVKGCALLWGLVRKAAETHHLRHTERLALLYTLGHLGEAGQTYLHQVIGLCSNYDPRITQRWIQRMDEGHKPIRCATLQEWLKDHLPGVTCACGPTGTTLSPLDLLRRVPPSSSAPSSGLTADGWDEVARDLFSETLVTDDEAPSDGRT